MNNNILTIKKKHNTSLYSYWLRVAIVWYFSFNTKYYK